MSHFSAEHSSETKENNISTCFVPARLVHTEQKVRTKRWIIKTGGRDSVILVIPE
ncbi:unnamed protein product [Periconia digitata]|uniref:Uncharacterized protein n=1 Tax=Periconia digitata TaxID=1303443 RepID=A0A9W4U564_9PLEO|nr:unnamed protein product [Periconia digitata]